MHTLSSSSRPRPHDRAWLVGTVAVATGAVALAVLGVGLASAEPASLDAALAEPLRLCLAFPR